MSQIKRSTILVPVDFTTQSQCAIEHAMRVAKTAVNEILLFHVLNSESKASLKKSNLTEKDLVKMLLFSLKVRQNIVLVVVSSSKNTIFH